MNFREFTEEVDHKAGELNKEELQCFIHSIARKVPEGKRGEFIGFLEDIRKINDGKEDVKPLHSAVNKVDEKEIKKEFSRLKKLFKQIQDEELCLQAQGYEDYSGNYEDDWAWEYEDPQKVCQVYEGGCGLLMRCVNDGFFKEACDLFDLIIDSEVIVLDGGDGFSMNFGELADEKLVSVNLDDMALHVLYAAYQSAVPNERPEKLYDYFQIRFFKKIKVEDMFVLGREELKGLPEFWDAWIKLLIEKDGDIAGRLLKEAVVYQGGGQAMLDVARFCCKKHPALYLEVLVELEKAHDSARQLEVGREALEKIESKYIVRSKAALKTAEAALRLGEDEAAEGCWLEAFLSDTTPVNYLRIVSESKNPQMHLERMKKIILSAKHCGRKQYSTYDSSEELAENCISDFTDDTLRFLNGNFEFALEECCKVKQALGWSGTFVKCGIALFLLLLLKDNSLKQGCSKMEGDILSYMDFKAESYFTGTKHQAAYEKDRADCPNDREVFWQCFTIWKSIHVVSDEQALSYVIKLQVLIDKRIKAIVSGQYRNHYGNVAALAAALGEVKESMGINDAKEAILQKYRADFPRHSAFHEELRAYGMKDTRKK